jgi:carbon-monoxide dehydrogenase large subunit
MLGQSIKRFEDERFIKGIGQYTDDIKIENQAYAFFLRSQHAHARILSIDISHAKKHNGVLAILTSEDYVLGGNKGIQHYPNPADAIDSSKPAFALNSNNSYFQNLHLPLAYQCVRHVGEAVVMVIAKSVIEAQNASELILIDYEVLSSVVQADDAICEDAPQIWKDVKNNICHEQSFGNESSVNLALKNAPIKINRKFVNSRIVNAQMEPRSAIGLYEKDKDLYTLISGSQGVYKQKQCLQESLNLRDAQVRVICPDVGGGFGPRTMLYPEQLAVVWASKILNQPVKWTSSRSEGFVSDYQGRDQIINATFGFDQSGKILAIKNNWISNIGAHSVSFVPASNGMRIMTTVYDVPNAYINIKLAYSNTVPTGPYRGAGRPESHHVIERMLDVAADAMNIDRIEIRKINLIRHDQLPYTTPMGLKYDSGTFIENMYTAVKLSDWNNFQKRKRVSASHKKLRGIGIANYIEAPVGAPIESISIWIKSSGEIEFITGTQSQGQGHETTFRQVIEYNLGIDINKIVFRSGDTDYVKIGGGTHSDRSMRIVSHLIMKTSGELINQGMQILAIIFDMNKDDIFWNGRSFSINNNDKNYDFIDIAKLANKNSETAEKIKSELKISNDILKVTSMFKGRIPAHPTGCAICELDIDQQTGEITLLNYTSIDDVGQVINPMIVDGQIHGGLAQGIGQALSEGYYLDSASGQVLSGSFMDYGVPRAGRLPRLKIQFTEDPTLSNEFRIKGGGESGITPATAAIFNAIAHALSSNQFEELPMPATSSAVWNYIQNLKEHNEVTIR